MPRCDRKTILKEFSATLLKEKELMTSLMDTMEAEKGILSAIFESLEAERKEIEEEASRLSKKSKDLEEAESRLSKERESWAVLEGKLKSTQCKDRIRLDVGGCLFAVAVKHLQKEEGSYFSALVSAAWDRQTRVRSKDKEEDDVIFIDRDPLVFRHIVSALRGEFPDLGSLSSVEFFALRRDAEFYQMKGLVDYIQSNGGKRARDLDRERDEKELAFFRVTAGSEIPPGLYGSDSSDTLSFTLSEDFRDATDPSTLSAELAKEKRDRRGSMKREKEKRGGAGKEKEKEKEARNTTMTSPKRNFRLIPTKKNPLKSPPSQERLPPVPVSDIPKGHLIDPPTPPLSPEIRLKSPRSFFDKEQEVVTLGRISSSFGMASQAISSSPPSSSFKRVTPTVVLKAKTDASAVAPPKLSPHQDSSRIFDIKLEEVRDEGEVSSGPCGRVTKGAWGDKIVAVKCYAEGEWERSEYEKVRSEIHGILSAAPLHKNICEIYGACLQHPNIAIVMEYFPLGNLRRLIQTTRDTRCDEQEGVDFKLFLSICVDVCEGVAFLHKRQILHANIKPENVLVVSTNPSDPVRVKISDFSLSPSLSAYAPPSLDTLRYCAPETLHSAREATERADVYACALLFYEMMTCEVPFGDVRTCEEFFAKVTAGVKYLL